MTNAETVRRLLMDAADEALCDSCLAFACSVSLAEMRALMEELLGSTSFQRRHRCASCHRSVPAIACSAKCAHCTRPVLPRESALTVGSDFLHAACFNVLTVDESVRIPRKLNQESRQLIKDARRQRRAG
jgi:hypothetical protein